MNEAVRVHARRDERASCGYCRAEVGARVEPQVELQDEPGGELDVPVGPERAAASCPRCGVLVHPECLAELRGCPTLACETPVRRFLGAPVLRVTPRATPNPADAPAAPGLSLGPSVAEELLGQRRRRRATTSPLLGPLALVGSLLYGIAPEQPAVPARLALGPLVAGFLLLIMGPAFGAHALGPNGTAALGSLLLLTSALLLAYAFSAPLGRLLLWLSRLGTGPRS